MWTVITKAFRLHPLGKCNTICYVFFWQQEFHGANVCMLSPRLAVNKVLYGGPRYGFLLVQIAVR